LVTIARRSLRGMRPVARMRAAANNCVYVITRTVPARFNAASKTAKALTTDREAELQHALESFERSAAGLERLTTRLDSLRATLQTVSSKVDRGDGSLGKLVNDPKLYEEAKQTVAELKALIADIKANPKKYVNVKVF